MAASLLQAGPMVQMILARRGAEFVRDEDDSAARFGFVCFVKRSSNSVQFALRICSGLAQNPGAKARSI